MLMIDIYLEQGGDLSCSSTGDLALATGTTAINQRICRRLLTNPGDYLWNLSYGGGLGQFIGLAVDVANIVGVVEAQVSLESAIPSVPAPQVQANIVNAAGGYVVANITYADPTSFQAVTLNVSPA